MTYHPTVTAVHDIAAELLVQAGSHASRRAARTLVSGTVQRATLIALAEGAQLAEHDSPPAATIQVITGTVRLHTQGQEWLLDSGHLAPVPPQRHAVTALADAVILLTVALR